GRARVDRAPAAGEAGEPDAGPPPPERRLRGAHRLPGDAALMAATARLERVWLERPGVLGWLTTVDPKRIGLLYFWTTLAFFTAGGAEAMLMRTQLAQPDEHVVGPETFNQLLTMHGVTMIFFFIIPMTTGAFGNYLVPLMIGARD